MSATQDLVIRMKTDSQNFNDGIETAKRKVKDFKAEGQSAGNGFKEGMNVAKSAIGKIAIAVGAATAAIKTYKSFAEQTQSAGDKLSSTIEACKTSFSSLQREIMLGGNLAVSRLREMYVEAKKLADLRDELGTDIISQKFYRMKYITPFNEAVTEYQEAKKKKDETGMETALEKATTALENYSTNSQKLINDANNTVIQTIKAAGVKTNNESAMDLMDDLVKAQNGYLSDEAKVFKKYFDLTNKTMLSKEWREEFWKKIWVPQHPTYMQGKYGTAEAPTGIEGAKYSMKYLGYTDEQIANAEKQFRLSQINDKTYTEALEVLQLWDAVLNEVIGLNRRLTNMTEAEPTTPTPAPKQERPILEPIEIKPITVADIKEKLDLQDETATVERMNEEMAKLTRQTDDAFLRLEMFWDEQNRQWQSRIDNLNAYADALGNVSNIFQSLNSMAADDSPWKKFTAILGSVSNNITSLIKTYTSLIAVEAVSESIKSGEGFPFPYNLVIMAAAGAAIAGIISSIVSSTKSQSFATGGIVGGHDYHDGIKANLSSGEMVLNKQQQANLWNLIQGLWNMPAERKKSGKIQSFADGGIVKNETNSYTFEENNFTSKTSEKVEVSKLELENILSNIFSPFTRMYAILALTNLINSGVGAKKTQLSEATHSFATGGIVGGHNYHDGIHVNLSSGEMVLNKQQQLRLWNMIGGNVRTETKTENVVFKISGEDLVGVIDNYNKNSNY